jgi:hypothetical protein
MTEHQQNPASGQASFRGMASLLSAEAPQHLADLRRRFPSDSDLFDPTYVLGESDRVAERLGPTRQQAVSALIEATLAAGDRTVSAAIHRLSTRMRRVRTIRLGSALATLVAGTLTAVPAVSATVLAPPLLASGFAFAGSLGMLVGEHWEKPLAGTQSSLGELLGEVLVAEAAFADARLRLAADDLTREGALLDLARRVSEAAAKLRHVSVFGGVTSSGGVNAPA